jgi:cellulose synthase operon protein C
MKTQPKRSNNNLRLHALSSALCFTLFAAPSHACGPDFQPMLLDDRASTLARLPEGFFVFEADRLMPRKLAQLPQASVVIDPWFTSDEQNPISDAQIAFEQQNYTEAQKQAHFNSRQAKSGDEALSRASSLPAAHRYYLAGAVEFRTGSYEAAQGYFGKVLELGADGADRNLMAQFMLGRAAYIDGEDAVAKKHFAEVRRLAAAQNTDPLGLAIASLGDEAQILWQQLRNDGSLNSEQQRAILVEAIALYAEQAAQSPNGEGAKSLRIVARKLSQNNDLLRASITDASVQRLISAYAYARGDDAFYFEEYDDNGNLIEPLPEPPLVERILAAADAAQVTQIAGSDYLAAALYSDGRFELAQRYVGSIETPLANWVRAKLALRAGDQNGAAAAYAKAAKSFPTLEDWDKAIDTDFTSSPRCRVQGEAGTLALSRGDFSEAMQQFFLAAGSYSEDLAYVAERVLTLDELTSFVEKNTKAQPAKPVTEPEYYFDTGNDRTAVSRRLRAILARRLVRGGQLDKAASYFDYPEQTQALAEYAKATQAAKSLNGVAKAEQLFNAAKVARIKGMDIMGFELDPDFSVYYGAYSMHEHDGQDRKLPSELIVANERERFSSSVAQPNKRFHYRYIATQLAEQAADALPARSQAFAAVLCRATHWTINREPEMGINIYKRYLNQGAYVPWGGIFGTGQACPAPDFAKAQAMLDSIKRAERKRMVKQYAPWLGGISLVLVGLALVLRRRGKQSA